MDYKETLQKAKEYILLEKDSYFKNEVEELINKKNYDELSDRFYTELEFGTGGIRGVIGGGYNRLNSYIIQKTTQGLANYILKENKSETASCVIAYDSRRFSNVFAEAAATVLCANGIKTYLYSSLRSTPQLSFTVRQLNATAGIVITASHNPPEYNGYKVYWRDGGQIISPHDKLIVAEVRAVKGDSIKMITKQEAIKRGLLIYIDKEIDDAFISMVKNCALRPQLLKEFGKKIKIIYTPLHGTGALPIEKVFSDLGINIIFVEEQKMPDGNFPTVKYPNPEEAEAMELAINLAKKENAHLVLATDPDADRLGIAVSENGQYKLLTGNQLGVLLLDYILSTRKEQNTLPPNGVYIKSIVTTELGRLLAKDYGVECIDVLTGFKYIAEQMNKLDSQNNISRFIFGTEESYGFLVNTKVRDKDAVSAALLCAEMAIYYMSKGFTLIKRLNKIYEKYGYFEEIQISKYFKGEKGLATMNNLMEKLRCSPPKTIGGIKVSLVKDYLYGVTTNLDLSEKKKDINLPSSNVLQFICEDGTIITARPSGTEPKIKFYASCRSGIQKELSLAKNMVLEKINAIKEQIKFFVENGVT